MVGPETLLACDVTLRVVGPSGAQAWVRADAVAPAATLRAAPQGAPFVAVFRLPDALAAPGHAFDVVARTAAPSAPELDRLEAEVGAARAELERVEAVLRRAARLAELRRRAAGPRRAFPGRPTAERRSRRPRGRVVRALPVAGMIAGALLVADGVATLTWQEPLSALYAQQRQSSLSERLRDVDRLFATPVAQARPPVATRTVAAVRTVAAASAAPAVPGVGSATVGTPAPAAPSRTQASRAAAPRVDHAADARRLRALTAPGDPLGRVEIPSLGASFVYLEGTGARSLREGPGHYRGTALPGEPGTVGIAGHRTTYLAPFRRVNELRPGDRIVLAMPYGRFSYAVEGSAVVTPDRAEILRAAPGKDRLVLTACHPLSSSALRIVVWARFDSAQRS